LPWAIRPTFKRVLKAKSTEQFDGLPYLFSLLNCCICLWYGLPWASDGRLLVATVNGTGAVFQLAYISLFIFYADSKRTRVTKIFSSELCEGSDEFLNLCAACRVCRPLVKLPPE
jgi:hypothetical protein